MLKIMFKKIFTVIAEHFSLSKPVCIKLEMVQTINTKVVNIGQRSSSFHAIIVIFIISQQKHEVWVLKRTNIMISNMRSRPEYNNCMYVCMLKIAD